MMIFAIYDAAPEAYLEPFFSQNETVACRAFGIAANEPDHNFNRHAADLTLFKIGEWDEQSGEIKVLEAKKPLGCALEFIRAHNVAQLEVAG